MKVPQIDINPLRVLGVYANSTLREIEQNKAQLRAFARVGQKVEFPLWLRGLSLLLPMDDITEEMVTDAQAQISLQGDRDNYARFWFERGDESFAQEDEKFVALLNNNQVDEACELLEQRTDHAAYKNLLLLYVMKPDWRGVAHFASKCFEGDVNEFHLFMDEVVKASNTANNEDSNLLLYHFKDEFWKAEMHKLLTNNHKRFLDGLLDRLKHLPTDDANILKNAYEQASVDQKHLKALQNLEGKDSLIFQFYYKEFCKMMCITLYRFASLQQSPVQEIRWACKEFDVWWNGVDEDDQEYSSLRSMKTFMDRVIFAYSHSSDHSYRPHITTSTEFNNATQSSTTTTSSNVSTTTNNGDDNAGCTIPAAVIGIIIFLIAILGPSSKNKTNYNYNSYYKNTSIPNYMLPKNVVNVNGHWITIDEKIDSVAKRLIIDPKNNIDFAQLSAMNYSESYRKRMLAKADSLKQAKADSAKLDSLVKKLGFGNKSDTLKKRDTMIVVSPDTGRNVDILLKRLDSMKTNFTYTANTDSTANQNE